MSKYFNFVFSFMILVFLFLPFVGFAATATGCATPGGTGCLSNPLSGISNLKDFVVAILNNIVLPIGAIVVVFFIIYSGFLFVTAQGNEKKLEDAKKTFLYTIIGAAVLLGSVAIANAIAGTLCSIVAIPAICPSP